MQGDQFVDQSIRDYKAGLGRFREKLPDLADSYMKFSATCFRAGAVAEKNKHLIALGISVCAQDEYCIMYHTQQAMELGATEQEILETVGVCAAFGGGAALSQGVTLVQQVIVGQSYGEH